MLYPILFPPCLVPHTICVTSGNICWLSCFLAVSLHVACCIIRTFEVCLWFGSWSTWSCRGCNKTANSTYLTLCSFIWTIWCLFAIAFSVCKQSRSKLVLLIWIEASRANILIRSELRSVIWVTRIESMLLDSLSKRSVFQYGLKHGRYLGEK